ncbi:MAG: hypothetical protein ACK4M7_07690 [Burkholderiales bacterium]
MNKLLALTAVLGLSLVGCASYSPMGLAYTGGTTGLSVDNNVKPNTKYLCFTIKASK